MDRYYNCSGLCSELEVDYDKKEVRAKAKDCWGEHILNRDFGVITHYEFEYVKTEWAESDHEDSDSRDHHIQLCEAMRVNGPCEELGDFEPEEERLAIMRHDEVGLKLLVGFLTIMVLGVFLGTDEWNCSWMRLRGTRTIENGNQISRVMYLTKMKRDIQQVRLIFHSLDCQKMVWSFLSSVMR